MMTNQEPIHACGRLASTRKLHTHTYAVCEFVGARALTAIAPIRVMPVRTSHLCGAAVVNA